MEKLIELYNPYELSWEERISFPSTRSVEEYGNRIYNRYPARSVFLVPRAILASQNKQKLKVLDPFMGSGTTAIETVLSNNIPFGVELDPFARLVTKASISIFTDAELSSIKGLADIILNNFSTHKPSGEPNLIGIKRWFRPIDFMDLLKLRQCIIDNCPQNFLDFFLVTYADCVKPVSLMERQSLKPYISKRFPKVTKSTFDSFSYSFNAHFNALTKMSKACESRTSITWLGDDATNFEAMPNSIDIAITSPPYINALDYIRCIKVESAMCGLTDNSQAARMRQMQVGHEVRRKQDVSEVVARIFRSYYDKVAEKDKLRADTCNAYFNDIYNNLKCVWATLKPMGEYHVIIGDNIIRGVHIPTHSIIMEIAEKIGFNVFGLYSYAIKDHRTSIPRNLSENKIYDEFVIMLKKQ